MPLDPFRLDEKQRRGFERLLRESAKPEGRQELVDEIVRELQRMRTLVAEAWPAQLDVALKSYVVLDAPDSFGHPKEISRAYLVTEERDVVPFREESAESPAWSAAYLMTRDLGYVFAPPELAVPTFLAAELVFRRRFEIRTARAAQSYAKIRADGLDKLRRALTDKGFYDGLPNDLRAEPARLRAGDVESRIGAVVTRLGTYEGIAPATHTVHPRPVRVDAVRIRTWLRQFRTDAEVESALGWLERMKLVSRHDVHEAVRAFFKANPSFHGAWVCPFGNPRDSSAIVTYYVADIANEFELRPASFVDALSAGDGKPILFVDDFIGSGGQGRTIVCNWLGSDGGPLTENHGQALSPPLQAELKGRALGFVFVAGDPGGLAALQAEVTRVGLTAAAGHVHIGASELPRAFSGSAESDLVRLRVAEIGAKLLESSKPEKDAAWRAERALGYGNQSYLLLLPYNTPTQTLTLLWADGEVDGWRWLPLFPRRPKV